MKNDFLKLRINIYNYKLKNSLYLLIQATFEHFLLAGLARFELAHARVKVWCLTAWLQPNIINGVEDGTRTHGLQCHKLAR